MKRRALNEGVVVMYGVMAGGARLLLPPMFDVPLVRTLRAAMFERMARAKGVTLTASARRILVDLEESTTIRGNVTQGLRWVIDRFVPYSRLVDAAGNLVRTWGAGALMLRYLNEHRPENDPVMGEIEAERVRAGLRAALDVLELEQARAIADEALIPVRTVDSVPGLTRIERWTEAIAATAAELPAAWIDAAEQTFLATLRKYQQPVAGEQGVKARAHGGGSSSGGSARSASTRASLRSRRSDSHCARSASRSTSGCRASSSAASRRSKRLPAASFSSTSGATSTTASRRPGTGRVSAPSAAAATRRPAPEKGLPKFTTSTCSSSETSMRRTPPRGSAASGSRSSTACPAARSSSAISRSVTRGTASAPRSTSCVARA